MKRAVVTLLATLVALAGATMVLGWIFFDADEIGRWLLDDLESRTGLEMEAERFHFGVFTGLRVEELTAKGRVEQGDLSVVVDQLILEHRFSALLRGRLVIDRVEIQHPVALLEISRHPLILGRGGPARDAISGSTPRLSLGVTRLEIIDGHLEAREGDDGSSFAGLGVELVDLVFDSDAATPFQGLDGNGVIEADQMTFGSLEARNGRGDLKIEGGRVQLEHFHFDHELGPMVANLGVDFTREPFTYVLDLDGESLDLAAALKSSGVEVPIPGTLTFDATGIGPEAENMSGRGTIHGDGGAIPPSPVVSAVEFLLGGGVRVAGARAEPLDVQFVIVDNEIAFDPFALRFEEFEIEVEGDVDLEGLLALRLRVMTARESVKVRELPDVLYDVLTNEEGNMVVPIDIGGTVEQPRVTLDWTELGKMAGGAVGSNWREKGEELLKRGLEKLFGKD